VDSLRGERRTLRKKVLFQNKLTLVSRYLTWLCIPTKCFNVGVYRRKGGNAHAPASFFDPNNPEGAKMREDAAREAFGDILRWFSDGGVVAILDATNSTRRRRQWIVNETRAAGIHLMFVESVCDNEELVLSNILDVKVSSPDYVGQDPEKVVFRGRANSGCCGFPRSNSVV
jgi:6-phosphofructo-2-kinase / fructose-2,6-biphosphatase 2